MNREFDFLINWSDNDGDLIRLKGEALFPSNDIMVNSISKGIGGELLIALSDRPEGFYRDSHNKLWVNKPSHKPTVRVWPVLSEVEKNAMEVAEAMDGLQKVG
jgi:hypothetical protein